MDLDREQLLDLVVRYSLLADRHDGSALAALFVSDGRLELYDNGLGVDPPTRTMQGRAEIAAPIDELRDFRATLHFLGQHRSELDGHNAAHAETYCEASHVFATNSSLVNHVVGLRYLDDFVRTALGWQFARRRLDFKWVEHRPLATADQIARVPGRA